MGELRLAALGRRRLFRGGVGVHGVDLDVAAGQVHALVGLNGSGKTTLLRLVLGMLRADAGAVRIEGRDLAAAGTTMWARVGHLVERPFANPELDTQTNLAVVARLHGVPRSSLDAVVEQGLADYDLGGFARVRARVLSAGNRQRLGLASALSHGPVLIVLDEPTNALDPAGVIALRAVLLARAATGAGVLVSSHHLDDVSRIADQITVLNHGRVIGTLDPESVELERTFFALVHADDERGAT